MSDKRDTSCRLCGEATDYIFSKTILGRYDVRYYACKECGSQQTDYPFWLDESYAIPGLTIDVGAAPRSIKNWLAAKVFLDLLEIPLSAKGMDFGSGPGLFASLMRSIGRDFQTFDAFAQPLFSSYSSLESIDDVTPDVITAFEVFEHLPDPKVTLDDLMSRGAPIFIFTTWPVDDQPEDWLYYLPDCGQHVFFYSVKGLENIGRAHGYEMIVSQYFYVFYAPEKLSAEQVENIGNFSLNSIEMLESRVQEILLSVIMGNEYLDKDFSAAMDRFSKELLPYAS